MGREGKRANLKLRKRRLRWLEKERKKDSRIDRILAQVEEDFDENEVEMAKMFFADYLTDSGSFAGRGEHLYTSQLEKICRDNGLEPADGMLILDTADEVFSAEEKKTEGDD